MCKWSAAMKNRLEMLKRLEGRTVIFIDNLNTELVYELLKENDIEVLLSSFRGAHKTLLVSYRYPFLLGEELQGIATVSPEEERERDITLCFGKEWL